MILLKSDRDLEAMRPACAIAAEVLNQVAAFIKPGTISAAGLYTAPSAVSTGQTITLTATYLPDATKTAKATISLTVLVDVGHGSPNSTIQELFVTNFYRNGFYNLVSVPPLGDVKRLGTTGYVQEFQDCPLEPPVRCECRSRACAG